MSQPPDAHGDGEWISYPILDLRYSQTVVSTTPFASAKTPRARTERTRAPLLYTDAKATDSGPGRFTCKMTYPAALTTHHLKVEGLGPMRDPNNPTEEQEYGGCGIPPATALSDIYSMAQQPNAYWQHPPPTASLSADPTVEKKKLTRDCLHPLISALQASENQKAAVFNPNTALIASPNCRNPPNPCRRVAVASPEETTLGTTRGLGDTIATAVTGITSLGGTTTGKGQTKSVLHQNYSTKGALFDKGRYAPTEVAQRQATSLTEIAARAIGSAIHDEQPNHALPCNVQRAANRQIVPHSGPKGSSANRNVKKGLHSPGNLVVPPTQAFRTLSKGLQHILQSRGTRTRNKIAVYLSENQPLVQPPPVVLPSEPEGKEEEVEEQEEEKAEEEVEEHEDEEDDDFTPPKRSPPAAKPPPPAPKPPPEADLNQTKTTLVSPPYSALSSTTTTAITRRTGLGTREWKDIEAEELIESDGDDDPTTEGTMGSTLSLWNVAVRLKMEVPNPAIEPSGQCTVAGDVTSGRPLKILTPYLVSTFHSSSYKPHFTTYLAGKGLRMGDSLTKVQPPPPQRGTIRPSAKRAFSDPPSAPSAAFAFDDTRLLHLLMEKGLEVEQISLEGMQWLSADVLRKIGDFCPELRLLNLDRCDELDDAALVNIASKCTLLCHVNVSGCQKVTGEAIQVILENSPQLTVLCCHSIQHIDPTGSTFEALHKCRNLTALDLSHCEEVTDHALVCVAQHCPALVMLDLSGCHRIGDLGVGSIGGRCSALQIFRLKLCHQPTLTAAGLSRITQAPRNLKQLDLAGLSQMTDECLASILRHGQSIRRLSIAGCTQLTDAAVNSVNLYCKQLRSLNLSSCKAISLSSCLDLIHDIHSLRCLIVSESSISNAEVVILQSIREGCRVIRNQHRPLPPTGVWTTYTPQDEKRKGKKKLGGSKK